MAWLSLNTSCAGNHHPRLFHLHHCTLPTISSLSPPLLTITITHLHRLSSLLLVQKWSATTYIVSLLSFSSRNGARPLYLLSPLLCSPSPLPTYIVSLLSSLLLVQEWSATTVSSLSAHQLNITITHLHRLSSLLLVQEWSATTDAWD
jgi:hypothetical protein